MAPGRVIARITRPTKAMNSSGMKTTLTFWTPLLTLSAMTTSTAIHTITSGIATPYVSALNAMGIPAAAHIMNGVILVAVLTALHLGEMLTSGFAFTAGTSVIWVSFLSEALVITSFVFSDLIDGKMARELGRKSRFGAFWDSTLDRIGDGAVFGGLALYFAGTGEHQGDSYLYLCLSLYCLGMGSVTSYARARAESLGMDAKGGIAERADRLVSILVMTGFAGWFSLPILIYITLWALAFANTYTVAFRVLKVRRQALALDAAEHGTAS